MIWTGLLIALAMLGQYLLVRHLDETSNTWEKRLAQYKNLMRFAMICSLLFIVICVVALLSDYYAKGANRLLNAVDVAIDTRSGPAVVLLIAFFTGTIRLFFERSVDEEGPSLRKLVGKIVGYFRTEVPRNKETMNSEPKQLNFYGPVLNSREDSWFAWFGFSLAIVFIKSVYLKVFKEKSPPLSSEILGANQDGELFALLWFGISITIVVGVGYLCWIYLILFSKMTGTHHFSGHAVRSFLPSFWQNEQPKQAILIGPSHSGKTAFGTQGKTTELTTSVEFHNDMVRYEKDNRKYAISLTAVDPPGENMGDHIIFTSIFRADVLVFVLDLAWLDVKAAGDPQNYTLENWHNLIPKTQGNDDRRKHAKSYMQGFYFATKRDEKVCEAKDLFKVRTFIFYLNDKASGEGPSDIKNALDWKNLQKLSQEIGARFGVPEADCCCIAGSAVEAREAFNLLARPTDERRQMAAWPP